MNPDIRQLDFNLLKALDALIDERSVTKAADRLSLTQPAVSGMLNRLRESFDDPLFVRAQRGIVPTSRAVQLAGPVKQLLFDIERMLKPAKFEPSTAEISVTLASTDYALRAVLTPFIAALRAEAPNITVRVIPVENASLHTQMERGDVDIALVTPSTVPQGLHSAHLFDEEYVCVLRKDHPDGMGSTMTLDRFCDLDHALVSPSGSAFLGVTDEALSQIGRVRRVILSLSSFLALPEILKTSDLIAVVPSRLAVHLDGLEVVRPPVEIAGFTKTMAWHDRTERDPGLRWIRSLLLKISRSGGNLVDNA